MSAEQAVLGAVLLDPEQLTHLEWLAAGHFYRPVHQALFDALRKLRDDGHPALPADGPLPLSWVTDAVGEAGQHVRGLTAAYAHTLIQACPRTERAPLYGRMVLEGAIHRTVAQHAIRLHQAARADADQGGGLAAAGRLRRLDPRAALPVPERAAPPAEPIDRNTLLWDAQRRGLLADGTLPSEQLTAVCEGMVPGSADSSGTG